MMKYHGKERKEAPMTLKRRKELLEGLADIAESMGIYDRKSEVPVEPVPKKDISKSGIKIVCERYGVTYTECPYAKGQFFDDMYNLRRLAKRSKSDDDEEVILLCKKALRKIDGISYHDQKEEISNLNRTLISMLK